MGSNGSKEVKENVVKLEGREFKIVGRGLDEKQVASFIKELVSEREELIGQHEEVARQSDILVKSEEHFSSLSKLAERTVIEADKIAEETKREAIQKAKHEADAIIAEAREQAKQAVEETKREIVNVANKEAEAIRSNTVREAELLVDDQKKKVKQELGNKVHQLYDQVTSHFESLKQQAVTSEEEVLQSLSQLMEQDSTVSTEKELSQVQSEAVVQDGTDVTSEVTSVTAGKTGGEVMEVEILPPIDITKVVEFTKYLDSLAEVRNTELIPINERPIIVVSFAESFDLIEELRSHPIVVRVEEVVNGENVAVTDAAFPEGKRKKIQIELSE
ncbi:MAG: DivIVA domain-containing protein, partial [Candidatus Thorarchaeota archaeon]